MAQEKYVAACVNYFFGGTGELGIPLGEFRKIEFARTARERLKREAQKKGWTGRIGIFFKGKFVEEV